MKVKLTNGKIINVNEKEAIDIVERGEGFILGKDKMMTSRRSRQKKSYKTK